MVDDYNLWLDEVRTALDSINMPLDIWQKQWPFPFEATYKSGVTPNDAAEKANRFWWCEQNKALMQDCRRAADCWLPRGHRGDCQPR
jgi:hypothetical protein